MELDSEGIRGFGGNRQIDASGFSRSDRQDRAGALDVAPHLVHEGGERIELALFPDALDEFDFHVAPVKIAAKVQQMDLEQRRTVVDGGPDAETGDAWDCFAVEAGSDGIDAVRKPAGRLKGDVRGRNAERAAEPLALDDGPDTE